MYKKINTDRLWEMVNAFSEGKEVWLSSDELKILIPNADPLKPGERVSSETGEVKYSAEWL